MKVIQLAMSVSGGRLPGGLSPGAIVNPRRSLMIISQQSILYKEWSGKYYRLFQRANRCCIFVEAAPVWSLCCLHRTHERLERIVYVSGSANDRKRWLNMSSKFADIQGDVFEKIFYQVGSGIAFRNPLHLFDKALIPVTLQDLWMKPLAMPSSICCIKARKVLVRFLSSGRMKLEKLGKPPRAVPSEV